MFNNSVSHNYHALQGLTHQQGNIHNNLLFVFSAPSGGGKTTLVKRLLNAYPEWFRLSISATTRPPRGKETHGKDYLFLSEADFKANIESNAFVEYANVFGNYYGTLKSTVESFLVESKDVLFDIDTQGHHQLKALYTTRVVSFFILPPSYTILRQRIFNRAENNVTDIEHRLKVAKQEISQASAYDYLIINDDLDATFAAIVSIVFAERLKRIETPLKESIVSTIQKGFID